MDLKGIYLQWEDKWYSALDKIDQHVPIYKVIDKIDTVVPSFAVFIALILLLAIALVSIPLVGIQASTVTITVEDSEGNLLKGVEVSYSIEGVINSATTNEKGEIVMHVPKNSNIEIKVSESTIEGTEFEKYEQTFSIEEESAFTAKIVLRQKAPAFVERTILFQDGSGQRITGKNIKVRLSCQNPLVTPSPLEVTDLDQDGSITVTEPRDCGVFQATVLEPTEFKQRSYILNRGTQTIKLEAPEVAKGNLRVRIKDASGNIIVSTNFDVKLLDQDGLKTGQKYTLNYGEAFFTSITSGTYSIAVEDQAGGYGIASQAGLTVTDNETTVADIIVSRTVKVKLNISIIDKATRQAIPNAVVKLLDETGLTITEKTTGEDAEDIEISLTDQGNFTLSAEHPDYLYEIVELEDPGTEDITIEMEEVTEDNSGRMKVTVVDEDDNPVENARVKLRFLETGMLVPIEPVMTNEEGIANFIGLKEGAYYAYVEKFPASGDNMADGREIDLSEVTEFKVVLVIGNTLVIVRAVDEDSEPVSEAEAEFFSIEGESLGKIPLTNGEAQFELKADKKVYVIVSHSNYMPVQTMPAQLWPDESLSFEALMEPRLILGLPKVVFDGMTDSSGTPVQQLKSGNKYVARFKLSIPEEGNYESGGFHFRIGDERILINDPMAIKEAIAGNINSSVKSTSFNPPTGYDEDSENATEGDGKWINIYWNSLEPMNYYFGFEIRVKSQVMPYTRLPMHYRAWAINDFGEYIRVPEDAELGISESLSGKQALYAKTFDLEFLEGQEAECTDDFCYSGESILDESRSLYIYEPYEMKNSAPYKYTFSILNKGKRQYDNSELYITVDGLNIKSYKIQNASAQEVTASNLNTKEIGGINLGAFTEGKSISGEMSFVPKQIGLGEIEVKIVADSRIVFSRKIPASIFSEKEMVILLNPDKIHSNMEEELKITILDSENGLEISEALVSLTIVNPNKTETFHSKKTNLVGIASFKLPQLKPNTKITVEAEKPGYHAEPSTRFVDGNILTFEPDSISETLDTRGTRERFVSTTISNHTNKPVKIESVGISGNFKGLLDKSSMEYYSKEFVGQTINANDYESLRLFKTTLSNNAKKSLTGNTKVRGEYLVTFLDDETGAKWDFVIPVEVNISIGGLPENTPCISITKQEWKGVTQGNRATVEFEIKNNCRSGNRFLDLDNLQAKITWTGDEIGVAEISITEAGTGASNMTVLRSLVWTKLFDSIRAEETYYAILTFTPKAGHLGEKAKFDVLIDGEIMTDSGMSFVGSNPNTVKSEIDVINLEQCIQYPNAENIVEIGEGTDFATFSIDTSLCGETPLDIYLCYMDSGCRGGALEGEIGLIPEKISLNPNNPVKEIRVERRSIPGMYGITVFAKIPGSSYREVHVIDLAIKPEQDNAFFMDKYNFTILGIDSEDSTMLTNTQVQEDVKVKASACAWGEASEKGLLDGKSALAGAAVAQGFILATGLFAGSTIGPAVAGLAFCPPCLVVVVIAAIVGGLMGGMFGDDPCEKDITQPLPDWVINLKNDALSVETDNPMIVADWVTENPKLLGQNEKQEVGISFKNQGIEDIKATYAVVTATATKHHHAQPTNYGEDSNFGTYRVKDRETTVYTQKFHLKFDTKIAPQQIPLVNYDTYECTQGTLIGRTGPGAVPRTKISWDWGEKNGISINECDHSNENYIYCDATQFSIELSKKLHALDTFLELNRENLVCPEHPMERYAIEFNEMYNSRTVQNGYMGVSKTESSISGDDLEISFEVTNDTVSTQIAEVTIEITTPEDTVYDLEEKTCVKPVTVASQQSNKSKCVFENLPESKKYYGLSVSIGSATTDLLDTNGFSGGFKISEEKSEECWLPKTTTLLDGKPAIEYFFGEIENVIWTSEIPDLDSLGEILHFKAYLMKDGFSEDFRKDFAEYNLTKDFYNAPEWFSDDPEGKIADYFEDEYYLGFTRRFVDSHSLPNAGLYDVVLDINFVGDDWSLFNAYSEPNAKIKVEFYFLKEPYPNNIFYYTPFNGNVGVDSPNGRQGYGVDYMNMSDEILLRKGDEVIKTLEIPGSTAITSIVTEVVKDFKKINSTASNRGFIMSIDEGEDIGKKEITFYPNYATPVIMKMSQVKTEEPFAAFYELRENGSPVETGNNLTFWEGAGQCLDFAGIPIAEAFDFKPDREANETDPLSNWQFAYAVEWTKADYAGDIYLKSVFYTPIKSLYTLKAIQPEKLMFITPNSQESQAVNLNGISGMQYNNVNSHDYVDSLRKIFELVEDGKICAISTGVRTAFWWNPKVLYEESGSHTSTKDFEKSLVANDTCIGYGN